MKPFFKNLIQEILNEIFVESINLNQIDLGSNITILFKDNKIKIKKIKDRFIVLDTTNPERVKPGDIIEFIETNLIIGMSPQCYIYRKNEIDKYKKINMVHKFSSIESIESN